MTNDEYIKAIEMRRSRRAYGSKPLSEDIKNVIKEMVDAVNETATPDFIFVDDATPAFRLFTGKFSMIVVCGPDEQKAREECGYWGERLVLTAQTLGLNTCWVGGTYKKIPSAYQIASGEKLVIVISVGYGATQGHPRKSKTYADVARAEGEAPRWFKDGVAAALLAPTALNQQKFTLTLRGDRVQAKAGLGFFTKTDLGIVKCHFEIGAGRDESVWA